MSPSRYFINISIVSTGKKLLPLKHCDSPFVKNDLVGAVLIQETFLHSVSMNPGESCTFVWASV